ncbi:hypothetical protein ACH4CE_20820 [Streptomyces gelaticus]|uniref:hypothetical protein n=1 Tax=Streptomyces gelaticus TaxID=285446 RepID=UPI00379583FC
MESASSEAVLYERTATGRQAEASWPARNALRGWTTSHRAGDLRSPVGVFTLSDAGGRLADPGSALPYGRSPAFRVGGTGLAGEPLAGSFVSRPHVEKLLRPLAPARHPVVVMGDAALLAT